MRDHKASKTSAQDVPVPQPGPEIKKKKKNRRPKSKRGKGKPTGFEEYYVDAPMTPEEFKTERDLYNVSRPLIHRIEDALLRYQNRRRLESDRRDVFYKYLIYGGVDVGPKMFEGTGGRELQEMDKDQILVARGQTSIHDDRSNLAVDFNAVVKGYLTSYFPFYFNPESEEMVNIGPVTIRNFLSYLLYHDVCPEYKASIEEARISCDIAGKELWKNQQLTAYGPGYFNTACSTLFGGFERDIYVEDNQWENPKDRSAQMTREMAVRAAKLGLACGGSDELADRFNQLTLEQNLEAKQIEDIDGFEVVEVRPPNEDTLQLYEDYAPDLCPVGLLIGRPYRDPGNPGYDLRPEERQQEERHETPIQKFEFFLEEDLLQHCYPRMKIITKVWEMNCGFYYFEDIGRAYSSIYTVLANDLMLGWKKPRDLRSDYEDEESEDEDKPEGTAPGETDFL